MATTQRDYTPLTDADLYAGERHARMQQVVDLLWEAFAPAGVSWVGFYVPSEDDIEAPPGTVAALVLGPMRDKPACSPIGMHGACGQAFGAKRPLIVRDVAELGEGYIACDPRDRSEVVVPLLDADGRCQGVLDLDSHELAAFDASDVAGLTAVLRAAALTAPAEREAKAD
jgi:putative methionine-R-sulfoxide reductase with GAF domain